MDTLSITLLSEALGEIQATAEKAASHPDNSDADKKRARDEIDICRTVRRAVAIARDKSKAFEA